MTEYVEARIANGTIATTYMPARTVSYTGANPLFGNAAVYAASSRAAEMACWMSAQECAM